MEPTASSPQPRIRPNRLRTRSRVELDLSPRLQKEFAGRIIIHYGEPPKGYSWPSARRACLLSVALLHSRRPIRPYLAKFLTRLASPVQDAPGEGHPIPLGGRKGPVSTYRIILAGDAAPGRSLHR